MLLVVDLAGVACCWVVAAGWQGVVLRGHACAEVAESEASGIVPLAMHG